MHLFAGAGGGILADLILGHAPVVAVEWDEYCCEVLRERVNDGWFAGMQVWEGGVTLFDPSEYTGRVDCIHAGFPCTDLSVAGAGAGLGEGTRSGLYREVLRVADTVRPSELFLENVSSINSSGVGTVYGDLAARGYEFRTICLRASDVGANHHRDRWWCLARRMGDTDNNGQAPAEISKSATSRGDSNKKGALKTVKFEGSSEQYAELADTESQRFLKGGLSERKKKEKPVSSFCGEEQSIPNTMRQGLQGGAKARNAEESRSQSHKQPAGHGKHAKSDYWSTEPAVGRVADGVANRTHRIKAIGNGQVPLQAAAAYKILESLFLN